MGEFHGIKRKSEIFWNNGNNFDYVIQSKKLKNSATTTTTPCLPTWSINKTLKYPAIIEH